MTFNFNLPGISHTDIAGYRLSRSPVHPQKINVNAVNASDEVLVCVASELESEEAINLAETLNKAFDSMIPDEYETREVQMPDGTVRFYQVVKG